MQRGQLGSCVSHELYPEIKNTLGYKKHFYPGMPYLLMQWLQLHLTQSLPSCGEAEADESSPAAGSQHGHGVTSTGALWCHASSVCKTHPTRKLWYSFPRASLISGVIGLELTLLPHRHVLLCL